MNAGQTDLKVGTTIQIQGITGEDKDLNGLTGTVTHPFAFGETKKGWVGIYLDNANLFDGKCNVKATNCKIL